MRQSLTAINAGTAALPCGAGFHSVFNTPERARITASPWYWEILRPRYLVSGRQLLWDRFNPSEWFDPARHVISFHTRLETGSLDGKPFRGAILDYGVKTVLYEVDQSYRYWYLWNQDPRYGFFCPEPMSWMVDAPISNCLVTLPGSVCCRRENVPFTLPGSQSGREQKSWML